MKKQTRRKQSEAKDTMRPEYDFSKGVRGKHAAKYAEGTNVVVLEPDVAREFRTTEQVNESYAPFPKCFSNIENVLAAKRFEASRFRLFR